MKSMGPVWLRGVAGKKGEWREREENGGQEGKSHLESRL